MGKKIGILGGTFDPFHKGHLMIGKTAYEQFELDEVWVLPNANPPHKRDIEQTDYEIRCEMISLAIKNTPYLKLCDAEKSEKRYHYTYETLERFKENYPEDRFYFIIGADSLRDFPTWREPERIADACTLLVACRDASGISEVKKKIREMEAAFGAECLILNSPKIHAASKEIRAMILEGKNVSEYLEESVCDYIEEQNLYRGEVSNGRI